MKRNLSLVNLNKDEIEKSNRCKVRAGIDTSPAGHNCECLCAPETDRGWKEEYKKNN